MLYEIPVAELNEDRMNGLVILTKRLRRVGPKKDRIVLKKKLKERIAEYKAMEKNKK